MKSELNSEIDVTDWGKCQLVIIKDKSMVVLTNGVSDNATFEGTIVSTNDEDRIGEFSMHWSKKQFTPLSSDSYVKLQND